MTQSLLNSSSQGPSLLHLTYIVRAGFPKRCIMAIWQHYETSPLRARLALSSAAVRPSRWFTHHKDPHHLLKRGPLETLNKSKESSSQNFWAWKSHRVTQSRPHLNHFQLYRLMKRVRTLRHVQPWGPASCASGLPAASQGDPTAWEKLEKCLEILARTVRTKFCVFVGLLEWFYPLSICCEQLGRESG